MKKVVLALLVFTGGVILFSACQKDHCPAQGQAPKVEKSKNA
jgi:hypothetical protein